ncbi:hypothetical protein ACTWPT_11240 [Nonomuraea sp. 3N208]|uniref:hypothetical protein n=1 Tax=Nonomuraea sp. 3N208 TaxID=3457421 RepID=UPI003FCE7F80
MTTFARPAALVLLAGLVAACSPGSGSGGGPVAAGGKADKTPLTVEQLSAKVGCKPRMQVNAAEIRTGYCRTPDGAFFVTTFRTKVGKDRWMDSVPTDDPHLVGRLWAVLSSRQVLGRLKERLGGDLHTTDHRTKMMRVVG